MSFVASSRGLLVFTSILALYVTATTSVPVNAKKHKNDYYNSVNYSNQTSMEIFPIRRGYDGAEFIVTKEGYWVSIPGLGVAPDATEIAAYRDAQNNYWYVDRNNNHIRLTPQQVEWGMSQINQQAQARAASGQPPIQHDYSAASSMFASGQLQQQLPPPVVNVQQPIVQNQQVSAGTGSGAGSAIAAGLAAAGGAFAGAALGGMMYNNNYRGVPYGVPMFHDGRRYYYNDWNGRRVYVNNSNNKYINQWNHQGYWDNDYWRKDKRKNKNRSSSPTPPPVITPPAPAPVINHHISYPHFPVVHSNPHFTSPNRGVNRSSFNSHQASHQNNTHSFSEASRQMQRSARPTVSSPRVRTSSGGGGNRRR